MRIDAIRKLLSWRILRGRGYRDKLLFNLSRNPPRCYHLQRYFIPPILILCIMVTIGESSAEMAYSSIPERMIPPLTSSFMKLIPQFNPNAFTVQFKTDARIALSPANPSLVPFLCQYPTIALNEIGQSGSEDVVFQNGMITFFKSEYGKFLSEIGLPVGCISFYAGATDVTTMRQLESLSNSFNYGAQNGKGFQGKRKQLFVGIDGNDLVQRLNLGMITGPFREDSRMVRASKGICDKIFWILKDGTIVANLPTVDLSSRQVWIPTLNLAVNIYRTNVTHELSEYFSTGVSCLEDNITKRNFSSTMTKWMSARLIPQILQTPRCIPGFPRVLQLLISIEKYKHTLVYVQQRQPPESVDYHGDYYYQDIGVEPYYGPLQPVQSDTHHKGHISDAGIGSGILAAVLIILFIVFICGVCCCLIALCCPDLKTCSRIQKILLRAKRSLEKLRTEHPSTGYDPIFDDDPDPPEIIEKPNKKRDLIRHQRSKRERKCRPKIEIPICSDTSVNICITTEDDCESSESDPQDGYMSKELDINCYQESQDSPGDIVKEKAKDCPSYTPQQSQQYLSKSKYPDLNPDIEDRYQDIAKPPKRDYKYLIERNSNDNRTGKSDGKKSRQKDFGPYIEDDHPSPKKQSWNYNSVNADANSLGAPPPPRPHHNKKKHFPN